MAGTVGVPVEVTVAGVTAAAMAAEVSAVTVAERVVVGKVLAMAVVRREAAMDLETLEQEVAAERAQDLRSIFPDQTREAKALALPWRGRGHSTCCQQDAVRCRHKQTPNLAKAVRSLSTREFSPGFFPPCSPYAPGSRPGCDVMVVAGGVRATGRRKLGAGARGAPAFWCAQWTHGKASATPPCFEHTCSAQCPA